MGGRGGDRAPGATPVKATTTKAAPAKATQSGAVREVREPERARVALGLTVAQMAKRLGLCESYVRHSELHGNPSFKYACRASRAYGCRMEAWAGRRKAQTKANKPKTRPKAKLAAAPASKDSPPTRGG